MKRGRTIVAEREQLETASERMQNRQKMRRKKIISICIVFLIVAILVVLVIAVWQILNKHSSVEVMQEATVVPTVEVIDETGLGLSNKMKEYIGFLELDFSDLGYKIKKVVLPQDKNRELLVYLDGRDGYIKVNTDRGTAVSAEDADRMIHYLDEQGSEFEYIDVRTEEKGYYK